MQLTAAQEARIPFFCALSRFLLKYLWAPLAALAAALAIAFVKRRQILAQKEAEEIERNALLHLRARFTHWHIAYMHAMHHTALIHTYSYGSAHNSF